MLRLWHAPLTRSVRVRWLLEELGVPYALERVAFAPPAQGFFAQQTPLGKLPVVEDDGVVFAESGAILQYVLERHGEGRLEPAVGSPQRGPFLQWIHFAEGTLYPPIGNIVFHTLYKQDAAELPTVIEDSRGRARSALDFLVEHMGGDHALGAEFSAADIMLGFCVIAAQRLGVLEDRYPSLEAYVQRLLERPALQRAMAD